MKNKKMMPVIILMTVLSFSAFAQQQQYDPESDFEASPIDGGKSVAITNYVGSKFDVRIPSRIQGLPVTRIEGWAFFNCTDITSVIIPNSITSIGSCAFKNCSNLASVTIPNSVTSIEEDAFYDCTSLTGKFSEVIYSLADTMREYRSVPEQGRRDRYDDLLPQALTSQLAIVCIYSVWQPNALDGMDYIYLDRAGSTPAGQYAPAFVRKNGAIEKRMFAYDNMDFYTYKSSIFDLKQIREETVFFKMNGQDAWILRIETPIIDPLTAGVLGVVGCYCDIR